MTCTMWHRGLDSDQLENWDHADSCRVVRIEIKMGKKGVTFYVHEREITLLESCHQPLNCNLFF